MVVPFVKCSLKIIIHTNIYKFIITVMYTLTYRVVFYLIIIINYYYFNIFDTIFTKEDSLVPQGEVAGPQSFLIFFFFYFY